MKEKLQSTYKRMPILYKLSIVMAILAQIVLVYVLYSLFAPVKILEVKNLPMPILNKDKKIQQGEMVEYFIDYCKYKPLDAETIIDLQDGVQVASMELKANKAYGCRANPVKIFRVPDYTPPGEYHLRLTITYRLNAFRTAVYELNTEKFIVIPKNKGGE